MLGAYPVEDYMRIQVTDTNPHRVKNQYTDVSLVEKFELTEDEYEKRTGKYTFFNSCKVIKTKYMRKRHCQSI